MLSIAGGERMQFRKISESMTDHEAETLLHILLPESKMKEINRLEESNCVDIIFEFQEKEWILTFCPDEIDNISEELNLENKGIYQVYMLANGYSEYLKEDAQIQAELWRDWIDKAQKNINEIYLNKNVKSAEILTDLENLVVNYRNLQGLIETFGAGAKTTIGDCDISQGIYAIAESLAEQNGYLEQLLNKLIS